jgi:hypothetical protein
MRRGIGRDIDKQLKRLKATLEAHALSSWAARGVHGNLAPARRRRRRL